jgi:GAF domain-containing protein
MTENLPETAASSEESASWSFGLQTKLILSYMIVTFIAIIAMGYYIYLRTLQSNALISSQLDSSVRQQAQANLTAAGAEQADTLNNFFASIRKDITTVSAAATDLLTKEGSPGNNIYWDAAKSLTRTADGSWDNSNSDSASVFIPSKMELTDQTASELNALKQLDVIAPSILRTNPDAIAIYFGGLSGETLYYPNIDLAAVVPPDFDVTQRPWFVNAAPAANPQREAVWSDPYLDAAQHGLVITNSAPVFDTAGNFRGVIAMDIQLKRITDIVSNYSFGQTGYAFLIDKNKRLIALSTAGYKDWGVSSQTLPEGEVLDRSKLSSELPQSFFNVLTEMSIGQSGQESVSIAGVERFIVFRPVPEVGYSLAVVVQSQEWLAGAAAAKEQISESTTNTLQSSFVLVAVILMLALLAALWIGNTLTFPLRALTQTAQEIIAGNLVAEAGIRTNDEIGTLAKTLNTMTATLRESIRTLERRVKERTAALEVASENASRRAAQFEAITQVTSAITSIRKMEELMPLVASVISRFFGFYHVGIFLNDEYGQNTLLIATNSEGGRRMLQRGHSLKIGEQGIVGYVAARGESRVARSVGEDIVFFNNPDLPETKSEAAIPLRSGNSIIGVLDVQSTKQEAFSREDMDILAILADQVSLAIENSRLFETTRRSLSEAETLYRQYLHEGWSRLPQDEPFTGYRYTPRGAAPIQTPLNLGAQSGIAGDGKDDRTTQLAVPIKLRGETIGNLIIQAPEGRDWRQDQIDLIHAVADRVALSAENARLFNETSRRAERERLVTEITSKIRSTNDPEEMIQTALEELRSALGATQIQVIPQEVSVSQTNAVDVSYSAHRELGNKTLRGNGANK